jgi:hypothetical protein
MRLCSNPSGHPAFERLLQLAEGSPVDRPVNDALTWGSAMHIRSQRQRRLSASAILQLGGQYRAGSTIDELAEMHEIHRTTVAAILERSGIQRRGKGPTAKELAVAIELYQEGRSTSKIGSVLGFSAETIRQRLTKAGVQVRKPHDWQGRS